MIRHAAVSGKFYSADKDELEESLQKYLVFTDPILSVKAIVVPHAGYVYSGAVAGEVFGQIKIPSTVVLLGPNHTGLGPAFSVMTRGVWRTPLGEVAINASLAQKLCDTSEYLQDDTEAHRTEHCLEVEIPFLQHLRPDVRIVPVVIGTKNTMRLNAVGQQIAACLHDERDAMILVSSDMTHYESAVSAKAKDAHAIRTIENLDEAEFARVHDEFEITMCGYAPAYIMIVAAKLLGAKQGRLIDYRTSGDVSGDYDQVVGYAGMIIT